MLKLMRGLALLCCWVWQGAGHFLGSAESSYQLHGSLGFLETRSLEDPL